HLLSLLLTPPPPLRSTLFPYTTLFRSVCAARGAHPHVLRRRLRDDPRVPQGRVRRVRGGCHSRSPAHRLVRRRHRRSADRQRTRSEEHTSELQSRENLVCRLLLEKKKK